MDIEIYPDITEAELHDDGLYYCTKCNTPRAEYNSTRNRWEVFMCDCMLSARKDEEARRTQEEAARKKDLCFRSARLAEWRFENADRDQPEIFDMMKNYADNFSDYLHSGKGLLLYGSVGTGKTFMAACIANRIIENGFSAYMTSISLISHDLYASGDKNAYLKSLDRYSLLILDDLGIERTTEYMREVVFDVVDLRYRLGKPLIVTTNLTKNQLAKPENMDDKRIYDRIIEMCHPIEFTGTSRRRAIFREGYHETKNRLKQEDKYDKRNDGNDNRRTGDGRDAEPPVRLGFHRTAR